MTSSPVCRATVAPSCFIRSISLAIAGCLLVGFTAGCQGMARQTAGRASLDISPPALDAAPEGRHIVAAPFARGPSEPVPVAAESRGAPEAEWTAGRRDGGLGIAARQTGNASDAAPLRGFREDQTPTATAHLRGTARARLTSLQSAPPLSSPPSTVRYTDAPLAESPLAISRIVFCREVRDFDDIVELAPHELAAGQTVLLFAALDNFRSQGQSGGYLTRTRSVIEIRARAGAVVHRLAPAEASDVSREPRHDFYLVHEIAIPAALPPGDYTLHLQIDDLLSGQRSSAQLPFQLHGGS